MWAIVCVLLASCAPPAPPSAEPASSPPNAPANSRTRPGDDGSVGATVYIPIYSHIYTIDDQRTTDLTATLSVRNTDREYQVQLDSVRYYDSAGTLLRDYLDAPVMLGPMASTEFVVARPDRSGGAGANFLVEWQATTQVTAPIMEAVMIGASSPPGVSFVSPGRVILEWPTAR